MTTIRNRKPNHWIGIFIMLATYACLAIPVITRLTKLLSAANTESNIFGYWMSIIWILVTIVFAKHIINYYINK